MSDDVFEEAGPDELDLSQLLRGQIALALTDGQVGTLVERHGLAGPIGAWLSALPGATDADERALTDLGIIVDGTPSEWFLALWRTVTAPIFLVAVDRLMSGQTAEWLYVIDHATFAEQIKTADGWSWLFGIHQELLARILLNIGLLRFIRNLDGVTLDPFSYAEVWTSAVTFVERAPDGAPRPRSKRWSYDGDAWTAAATDGSTQVVTPADVGEGVAATIGASVGEPRFP